MDEGTRVTAPEPSEGTSAAAPTQPALVPLGPGAAQTREGMLFVQRHAGNAAAGRILDEDRGVVSRRAGGAAGGRETDDSTVAATGAMRAAVIARRAHTRLLQRLVVPEGSPGKRTSTSLGDTGPGVGLLQRLLGVKETGTFDAPTRSAVDQFQRQQGWEPSGVGPMTWAALDGHTGSPGSRPNLNLGDRGPGVKLLQRLLGVDQTSFFGTKTRKAVDAFQRQQGWTPSGVGPMTWAALEHELNRLDVADRLGTMADPAAPTRAVWHPSGNDPDSTDFSHWAMAATEDPAFTVSSTTVINCWEMVLYSAYKSGVITWNWIHTVYTYAGPKDWYEELAERIVRGGAKTWDRATKKPRPRRGDIVMFDGADHVALATGVVAGDGTHVYSFWPPPTTAFAAVDHHKPGVGKGLAAGTPDLVKDTTIELLAAACDTSTHVCVVTVGPPAW